MKISYNWLKDYIALDKDPQEVSKILTDIGLEVENVELFQTIRGGLEGIVVGKVLTCEKHPNADKLSVTTVDIGTGIVLPIVCGAPNVAAGQTVLVATEGTTLYAGNEEFVIKKSKIRGEVSQGMICAEDEIGLGTSHDGIMVLPQAVAAGTLAKDYFKIEDDYIFEIGLTPNRIDAASHIGVARDLAAYLQQSIDTQLQKPNVDNFATSNATPSITVQVENAEACPRYMGLIIENIQIQESPTWLQNRLISIGLKPINNIVDITNFVLHETGQPLHAFDADKIAGNAVIVKQATAGSAFTTLDETTRTLQANDLMICNAHEPMCIAGVFGGLHSGITNNTTRIFLESAYFNPVHVRKTARHHALYTDSSFRFERGIDPNNTRYALQRAALLIQEIAGGTLPSPIISTNDAEVPHTSVSITFEKIYAVIGSYIEPKKIISILHSLDIICSSTSDEGMELLVPPYRVDVLREEDIIEEVLRIYGYNTIEIPSEIHSSIVSQKARKLHSLQTTITDMLVANGSFEIMNNSLSNSKYYELFAPELHESRVSIYNPLSAELDCMRGSLLFGMLETIRHNKNRQNHDLSLFEFGRIYAKTGIQAEVHKAYNERQILALSKVGKTTPQHWASVQTDNTFFTLKTEVHKILHRLGITSFTQRHYTDSLISGLSYSIHTKEIARFGIVHQAIAEHFDIDAACLYAHIEWDTALSIAAPPIISTEVSQFPEVRRDLALLVPHDVQFESIEALAFQTERQLLKRLSVFDVYQGKGVPEGKKSYAIAFILQDTQKTLTDKDIEKVMTRLIQRFSKELGAELR